MVRISVADTGEGISEDKQDALFQPFNRLGREAGEIEGTGIGLAITKQLIEAMDGKVGFESKEGLGSTFWVEFPALDSANSDMNSDAESCKEKEVSEESGVRGTVLYIEDNPANVKLMELIIEQMAGIKLVLAPDAETGLTIAEESSPDLILMDINLPGMDGFAAMKLLSANEITKDIPVIAVSAAAMSENIVTGVDVGFESYVTKPFNVAEIVEVINIQLAL